MGRLASALLAVLLKVTPVAVMALSLALGLALTAGAEKSRGWVEVRGPHFMVYGEAGEKQAREAAARLEQVRAVIAQAMPDFRVDPGRPARVLVFKDAKGMEAFTQAEKTKKLGYRPSGLVQLGRERAYVAYRIDGGPEDPYQAAALTLAMLLGDLNFHWAPDWLKAGMFGFYGSVRVRAGRARIGDFPRWLPAEARYRQPIRIEDLVRMKSNDPMLTDGQKRFFYYGECQALVHYLIFHPSREHPKPLAELVKELSAGAGSEEALRRVVGDMKEFQRTFQGYIRGYQTSGLELPAPPQVAAESIPIRGLSPGEVAALRGDFLIYAEQLDAAQAALEEALQLEPNLAAAQESMGLLLLRRKQPEQALPWVEKALASDPASSRGHLLRAQALAEASESAAKAEEVEAEFRKAIELDPRLAAAYHGLAEYYLNSNAKGKNILAAASQAAALEPANAKHQMTLARLFLQLKRSDLAEAAAQLAVVTSRKDEERSAAESLRKEARRSPGSQPAAIGSEEGSASDEKPALKRREGPERATARGRVVEVRCEGFALELELEGAEGRLRLHAGNYVQVEIFMEKSGERGGFRVCQDLRGVEVNVWYRPVDVKGYAGEIESIEVKK